MLVLMPEFFIRPARVEGVARLAQLRAALWPDASAEEHARELAAQLEGHHPSALPLIHLVAEAPDHALIGFVEVGLRSHADGCDPAHPVGYIEGWYVDARCRGLGVGRQLLVAAEAWARAHSCTEMASDALIDNLPSQRAHEALGYQVVDRCVHYRKPIKSAGDFEGTRNVPEPSNTFADDPFGGRHPTSHERMSGQPWDASYQDGPAPWDIGQPQPAIVRAASTGAFSGPVLDAGCGTGENSLHLAALGLPVLGVDVAETALAMAREKAAGKQAQNPAIHVDFAAADAFHLNRLGRTFQSVLDCGLFHTFNAEERPGYVASLASVTEPGGTLVVLCFSDEGPGTGPHPVREADLRAAFSPAAGWSIASIERDRIHTRFHQDGAPAWLATLDRL
ncbi:MAG TPA: bifunctional GNAT family N-acetyltransferase/class I SAM-dependent methyltransferase [Acidobacteriaceae bacterium]|jgi:SAM-dependent methyltransferase/ribosomal protein S18 acetylase RimI-like enzyme|nr:bifunctional GNAT family N-acetyltransferase/class I SAM-dependent methyltransferase [Acidobacteriaceae bacterium]